MPKTGGVASCYSFIYDLRVWTAYFNFFANLPTLIPQGTCYKSLHYHLDRWEEINKCFLWT